MCGVKLKTEKLEFNATDEDCLKAVDYVKNKIESLDIDKKVVRQFAIITEEIFINIAHYAYKESGGKVFMRLYVGNGQIKLSFKDSGIPFNPLKKEDPDTTLSAEERGVGGLGIFMMKKMMSSVHYYRNKSGNNILVMSKII